MKVFCLQHRAEYSNYTSKADWRREASGGKVILCDFVGVSSDAITSLTGKFVRKILDIIYLYGII
jgi:hypothetical protein